MLQIEAQRIAWEVHEVLSSLDPARAKADVVARMRERFDALSARLRDALNEYQAESVGGRGARVRERLELLMVALDEVRQQRSDAAGRFQTELLQLRSRLEPVYAGLAEALRKDSVAVPTLRPTNMARSLFHMLSGLASVLMIQHVLTTEALYRWVPLILPFTAWGLEYWRRKDPAVNRYLMRKAQSVAHPHETTRVNSGTWYATAGGMLVWTVEPIAACVAAVVLGIADPVASLVGRRFGKTRLGQGKSLEGTLGFFVSGFFAAACVLVVYGPAMPLLYVACIAGGVVFLGALAEALIHSMDDNFSVPLTVGWATALSLYWLGIPA